MACRFITNRGQPFLTFAEPRTPDLDLRLWPFLLNLVDNGREELRSESSGKGQQPIRHHSISKVLKNPIDPVYTVVEVKDGMFTISMPLGKDFKPEDLDVKVKDGHANIVLRIEQTSEDGNSQMSQVFTKKISLPEEVKAEELKSELTHEGVLKIRAPLPVPEQPTKPQAMDIPVTLETEESTPSAIPRRTHEF